MKRFYVIIVLIAIPSLLVSADDRSHTESPYKDLQTQAASTPWDMFIEILQNDNQKINNPLNDSGLGILNLALALLLTDNTKGINKDIEPANILEELLKLKADVTVGNPRPLTQALTTIQFIDQEELQRLRNMEILKSIAEEVDKRLLNILALLIKYGAIPAESDLAIVAKIAEPLRSKVKDTLINTPKQVSKPSEQLDAIKAQARAICENARNLESEILAKTEGYDDEIGILNDFYIVVLEKLTDGNDLNALRKAVARANDDFLGRLREILTLELVK